MSKFDQYLRDKAAKEQAEIPDSAKQAIEQALADLPEKRKNAHHIHIIPHIAAAAACFIFVILFLLPNVSVAYAQALETVPVIGNLVRVITIRNYFYTDEYHEMDIDVPEIEAENSEAADFINKDISELTDTLVQQFHEDLDSIGDNGHGAIYVDYETVTNTDNWFTLKLMVHEAAGSGNTYYKYYHINKTTGKIVHLSDLALNDEFYDVLTQEIKKQMNVQMESDSNAVYWLENSGIGEDFVTVTEDHNFYWNENGDLVIAFDKYEVAPGYMGTPEFVICKDVLRDVVNPEFIDLVS